MKELSPQGTDFAFNAIDSLENTFSTHLHVCGRGQELSVGQMESYELEDVRLQTWSSYVWKLMALKQILKSIFYYPVAPLLHWA